jgi:hypothetical protein
MKTKGIFTVGLLAGTFLTSCDELNSMLDEFGLTINTHYYEVEMIIPPSPAGLDITMQQIMENDIQQTLQDQGYGNATVKSIKVADASLQVMEDSNVPNLNAIESISANISTDNVPEVTFLSCVNTVPDATVLPFESDNTELSSYLEDPQYILTVHGILKEDITDTLHIKGLVKYQIALDVQTNL